MKADEPFQEGDGFFRLWFTLMFWGGCAVIGLKEWRLGSWEDVCGAWSVWGLATYGLLKWRGGAGMRPAPPLWRALPLFVIPVAMYGLSLRRFFDKEEYDWVSLVIPGLLLYLLVAREWFMSPRAPRAVKT